MHNEQRWFASDNNASAHPRIMEALARANTGHAVGYGDDPVTKRAEALVQAMFGEGSLARFVFNGTGANVYALGCLAGPAEAVLCSDCAHILVDETGAPVSTLGVMLIPLATESGKVSPAGILHIAEEYDNVHKPRPAVLSLSQPTELGTVYSQSELKALCETAHAHGMTVHVDGARLANAAVALGCSLKEAAGDADAVCLGGTKNGLMMGELVVFNPAIAKSLPDTARLRKNRLQLASKMRYIAAQFEEYLKDGLWRENALKANNSAQALATAIKSMGIPLSIPLETNALFVRIPKAAAEELRERRFFYDWEGGMVRWMASWDTSEEDIQDFITDLSLCLKKNELQANAPELNPDKTAMNLTMAAGRKFLHSNWQDVERMPSDQTAKIPAPSLVQEVPADAVRIALPDPAKTGLGNASFTHCTRERKSRRKFNSNPLSLDELSYLLWASAGVRKAAGASAFRTVPSGGCRHPLDSLVYVRMVPGIDPGLYRYLPVTHELALLRKAARVPGAAPVTTGAYDLDAEFNQALYEQLWSCAALFVWSAVPYRSEWRYTVGAAKLVALDAGHACQALYGACEALGLGTCAVGAYNQAALDAALGVDGIDEFAVYAAPVGQV